MRKIYDAQYKPYTYEPNERVAISLDIVLDYGGDVDFDESIYKIKTVEKFFNDKSFMAEFEKRFIKWVSTTQFKSQYKVPFKTIEKFGTAIGLANSWEAFSGGEFDAMEAKEYRQAMKDFRGEGGETRSTYGGW